MKKQYIKPNSIVLDIDTESLCDVSFTPEGGGSASLSGDGASEDAWSKGHGFSIWDDDEED